MRCLIGFVTSVFLFIPAFAENSISITSPQSGDVFQACRDISFTAAVEMTEGELREVRFLHGGTHSMGRVVRAPYEITWENVVSGNYTIVARLRDKDNNDIYSDPIYIRVGNISRGDLLLNGSFDCKQYPWKLANYNGAISTSLLLEDGYFDDMNYLMVEIKDGTDTDWHIQLQQSMPLDSGHVYEVSFLADADMDKEIVVGIQESHDPHTTYLWERLTIEGLDEYGPFVYESPVNDPTSVFKFCLGGNEIPFFVDDVRIIDRSLTSVRSLETETNGTVRELELYQSYPNPFNMHTVVPFRLSAATSVTIDIFNIKGEKIQTLLNRHCEQGRHTVVWDGKDTGGQTVPGGVYFYRMQAADSRSVLTKKVLLIK